MSTQFRMATDKDQEALKKIMKTMVYENEKDIENIIYAALNAGVCVVVVVEGEVVGAVFAVQIALNDYNSHYLNRFTILLHADHKNKGLGKELVQQFLSVIETEHENISTIQGLKKQKFNHEKKASTAESNQKLIKFYESVGFEQEGKLKNRFHYKDKLESEIILSWSNPSFK